MTVGGVGMFVSSISCCASTHGALVIKLPSLKNTHTAHTQKNIFWFCRLMVRVSWVVTNAVNLSIFPAAVNAVISFHYTQTLFNVISFDAVLALAQTVCGRLFPSSTLPVHKVFLSFLFIFIFFTSAYCSWSHWKKTILRGEWMRTNSCF